jgi:hypothetical protein
MWQIRSSAKITRSNGPVVPVVALAFVLVCLAQRKLVGKPQQPSRTASACCEMRFQVIDAVTTQPIQDATVILVWWQKKEPSGEKKELEAKTNEKGLVEFPHVDAQKFAITVTIKGYRSYWRWIRGPDRLKQLSLIKLEPWINPQK